MVHRACFGSIERFLGIITENYAGAFPVWLAPVQIKFLPISDKHLAYSKDLAKKFKKLGIRGKAPDGKKFLTWLSSAIKKWKNGTLGFATAPKGDLGAKPFDKSSPTSETHPKQEKANSVSL